MAKIREVSIDFGELVSTHNIGKVTIHFRKRHEKFAVLLLSKLNNFQKKEKLESEIEKKIVCSSKPTANIFFGTKTYNSTKANFKDLKTLNFILQNKETLINPLAFHEAIIGSPTTTLTILLDSNFDPGPTQIFSGRYPTVGGLFENRNKIFNIYISLIFSYLEGFHIPFERHDLEICKQNVNNRLFKPLINYARNRICRILYFRFAIKYLNFFHKGAGIPRWNIAYAQANPLALDNVNFKVIQNPTGRSFADPFVFTHNGETVIFVEDIDNVTGKGRISVVRGMFTQNLVVEKCLEEDFHLSFPHIFRYLNQIYMLPECSGANQIRIYKCVKWPNTWELWKILDNNINAVDTLYANVGGENLLMTNIKISEDRGNTTELYCLRLENELEIDKTNEVFKMVLSDASKARNGGFFQSAKDFYRVRQSVDFLRYGFKFSVARLNVISNDQISETEIYRVSPSPKSGIKATHHLTSENGLTVIDFLHANPTSSIVIGKDLQLQYKESSLMK